MSNQVPVFEQLCLFDDQQMSAMRRPKPAKRSKKPKPEPDPPAPISPGVIATQALVDCLRDAGYKGSDPVYDFFTGNHPREKRRKRKDSS